MASSRVSSTRYATAFAARSSALARLCSTEPADLSISSRQLAGLVAQSRKRSAVFGVLTHSTAVAVEVAVG
jgi:hypothetical protein